MLPPDPYHQSDQPGRPDAVDHTDDYPTPPPLPYYRTPDNSPLPLPYDDRDATYPVTPDYQPPAIPAPYPQRAGNGLPYAPPPAYQPPVQPQIIYVRERRPSLFSISCSILSILLLMTCGLVGLGIFRGVTSALQLASKTIPARITLAVFCTAEMHQDYHDAYQQFSSLLQQQVSDDTFTQDSQQLDQQNGLITTCSRSNNSVDTGSADTATLHVDITRTITDDTGTSTLNASHGTITFVQEGSDWHIEHIDTSLGLPNALGNVLAPPQVPLYAYVVGRVKRVVVRHFTCVTTNNLLE
jgi:hypothetical protein